MNKKFVYQVGNNKKVKMDQDIVVGVLTCCELGGQGFNL